MNGQTTFEAFIERLGNAGIPYNAQGKILVANLTKTSLGGHKREVRLTLEELLNEKVVGSIFGCRATAGDFRDIFEGDPEAAINQFFIRKSRFDSLS